MSLCLRGVKASPYFDSAFDSGFDSSFLRMRRSSIKLNAVIVHNTDANMIITLASIEVGSFPADHCISDLWEDAPVNPATGA